MNHTPKDADRCEFIFPRGRRCRQPRATPGADYCFTHAQRLQHQSDAARTAGEIAGEAGALDTQEGIHKALTGVFVNLARRRISPREASVLGYVGQLMLLSVPSFEKTIQSVLPLLQLSFKMGHQEKDATLKSSRETRKNALLEQEIINGLVAQYEVFRAMSKEEMLRMLNFASMFTDKPFSAYQAKSAAAAPPAADKTTNAPPAPPPDQPQAGSTTQATKRPA